MRKIALVLTVLVLTVPTLASVTITAVDEGCGQVRLDYTNTEPNKIRAFALDLSVTSGKIEAVTAEKIGESNSVSTGYGIFLDKINGIKIDGNGNVTDSGSPVADACSPGAAGGLGGSAVTIELGALYYPANDSSPNAPGNGPNTLCTVKVDDNCTLNIVPNTTRGGVVLTTGKGTEDDVNPVAFSYSPLGVVKYTGPQLANWRSMGKPDGWCIGCTGGGADYRRQCHGDADGRCQGMGCGLWVSTYDLTVLVAAYSASKAELYDSGTDTHPTVSAGGRDIPLINADFNHNCQGMGCSLHVSTQDLTILVDYYSQSVDPNCP